MSETPLSCRRENANAMAQANALTLSATRAAALASGAALEMPVTRLLTLHPNSLADFLLSLPVLKALRASFPGARMGAVMNASLAKLLRSSRLVDDIFSRAPGGLSQQTALMLQLHAHHFETALSLSPTRSSTMLAWSSGAPVRVGFEGAKMEALLTHRVKAESPFSVDDYLCLARAVGCAAQDGADDDIISISPEAVQTAHRVLGARKNYLVIAPDIFSLDGGAAKNDAAKNAEENEAEERGKISVQHELRAAIRRIERLEREYSRRGRRARVEHHWRARRRTPETPVADAEYSQAWWTRAIEILRDHYPLLLAGGTSPKRPARALDERLPGERLLDESLLDKGLLDVRGHLELDALAALIGGAKLLISGDEGLLQLAKMLGTPTLGVMEENRTPRILSTRLLRRDVERELDAMLSTVREMMGL